MLMRPATLDDAPALAQLGRATFIAAFGHLYAPDDLAAFLGSVHAEAAVAAEIAGDTCTHRLVEADGSLVAYCKLRAPSNYAHHSDARNPLELAQLYALPGHTGAGIGTALMEWTLGEARAKGCDAVQLSVWSENTGAQGFYRRYGFAKIADIDFWVGNHRDDEFLYQLRL
jgi:diamine N-acetyltransferase